MTDIKANTADGCPRAVEFDLLDAPGHLLRRCHQRSHDVFNRRIGAHRLTRQQMALMLVIRQNVGANQRALSEKSGLDRNTLSGIAARLLSRRLIRRRKSGGDARAYSISLTSKGETLLESLVPDLLAVQHEILAPLPQELRPVFMRCLRILVGAEATPEVAE